LQRDKKMKKPPKFRAGDLILGHEKVYHHDHKPLSCGLILKTLHYNHLSECWVYDVLFQSSGKIYIVHEYMMEFPDFV